MLELFLNKIEIITTIVLALNVILCTLNSKWSWPVGIIGVTIYGLSAWFLWGLYADALLQIFYFVTGVIGWVFWASGSKRDGIKIWDMGKVSFAVSLIMTVVVSVVMGHVVDTYTDSTVPYLDAATTVISFVGQVLLMVRVRSTWIFWLVANLLYIYMFYLKGLDSLALLYVAFSCNTVAGYLNWSRIMRKEC